MGHAKFLLEMATAGEPCTLIEQPQFRGRVAAISGLNISSSSSPTSTARGRERQRLFAKAILRMGFGGGANIFPSTSRPAHLVRGARQRDGQLGSPRGLI